VYKAENARKGEPRLSEAESRHCQKQSRHYMQQNTLITFGHVTAESAFRVTFIRF
jgi:hypothetical protein